MLIDRLGANFSGIDFFLSPGMFVFFKERIKDFKLKDFIDNVYITKI